MSVLFLECEITKAVNPISYQEVELDPPVKLHSWEEFDRFNDEWEKFCRRAADKGVHMEIARFELNKTAPLP